MSLLNFGFLLHGQGLFLPRLLCDSDGQSVFKDFIVFLFDAVDLLMVVVETKESDSN